VRRGFLYYDKLISFGVVKYKILSILILFTFLIGLLHDVIPHHHHESGAHDHVAKQEKHHEHDHDYYHQNSLAHSHDNDHDNDGDHKKDKSLFFFHKHSPAVNNRFVVKCPTKQLEKEKNNNLYISLFSVNNINQEYLPPPDKSILKSNNLPPPQKRVSSSLSFRGPPCKYLL
jgi:hypothetical protein